MILSKDASIVEIITEYGFGFSYFILPAGVIILKLTTTAYPKDRGELLNLKYLPSTFNITNLPAYSKLISRKILIKLRNRVSE